VAVSPQLVSLNLETAGKLNLDYQILSDPGNAVAAKFGLRFTLPEELRKIYRAFGIDTQKSNGDDSWTLPMPGRYLIGQDKVIAAADVDPDYTVRTEPEETLAALNSLKAGSS
jgi:peroxiredoxin